MKFVETEHIAPGSVVSTTIAPYSEWDEESNAALDNYLADVASGKLDAERAAYRRALHSQSFWGRLFAVFFRGGRT